MKPNRTMNLKWSYPDFPPRPIKRDVIFSLMQYEDDVYFVNGSDEILDVVSSESFGFIQDSSMDKSPSFYYENVKPNESVKVEQYDNYYDLDFVLGFDIFIKSKKLGEMKIRPPMKKGGVKSQELVFKDMTSARYVTFDKLD